MVIPNFCPSHPLAIGVEGSLLIRPHPRLKSAAFLFFSNPVMTTLATVTVGKRLRLCSYCARDCYKMKDPVNSNSLYFSFRGAVQKNFRANLGFCPNRLDPPLWSNLALFRNSQDFSHRKLLESLFSTEMAAPYSYEGGYKWMTILEGTFGAAFWWLLMILIIQFING